jgi:NAD(P)-dependent dehydrogenase (short-subunit alcohol dehydrogenase family)
MSRVVFVTGGASGIGAATVRRFRADGAEVVVADLATSAGAAIAEEVGARFVAVDVRDEGSVAAAVDATMAEHGRLDVMFANAGVIGAVGSIVNVSLADVDQTFAVNLRGVLVCAKHAARVMIPAGRGVIIATASPAGVLGGIGAHAYSAAKAGVLNLVRSLAAELRPYGIRVNSVIPGATLTPMTADTLVGDPTALAAAAELIGARSPVGRPVGVEDVAAAVAYLAGAEFVTGHALAVDAGHTTISGTSPYWTGDFAAGGGIFEAGRRTGPGEDR